MDCEDYLLREPLPFAHETDHEVEGGGDVDHFKVLAQWLAGNDGVLLQHQAGLLERECVAFDAGGGMHEVDLHGVEDAILLRGVEAALGKDRALAFKALDEFFVAVRSRGKRVKAAKLGL